MINNSRDAIGAALLSLGYSLNTTDESQLEEAFSLIKQAKDNGVYQPSLWTRYSARWRAATRPLPCITRATI